MKRPLYLTKQQNVKTFVKEIEKALEVYPGSSVDPACNAAQKSMTSACPPRPRQRGRSRLGSPSYKLAAAKPYCDLIRTILSTSFADFIGVTRIATGADMIGVKTGDVRHRDDQHAVTVNVDVVRGSSMPREVHRLASLHLVAARSERNLSWCGCRRRRWSCRRCRCGCRSRCGRRCWCWCRATPRRLDLDRHGRAGLKVT